MFLVVAMLACLDVNASTHTSSIQEDIDKYVILFYHSHELWIIGEMTRLVDNVTYYLHLST